ncbi:hypothetical protein V6N11_001992 [Hibiscus sabdariffa]|uniref:Uncharacterized protein n=1 Tax=Hibiscus sabdariffa TaxID=183260 RepID=A0ABR2QU19_9ROSI
MQICTVFGILLHLFIICKSMGIERKFQSKLKDLETPANHVDMSWDIINSVCSGIRRMSLILLFTIAAATFYSALLIQRCMDSDFDIGNRAFRKEKGD